jgi:hypothetical protein
MWSDLQRVLKQGDKHLRRGDFKSARDVYDGAHRALTDRSPSAASMPQLPIGTSSLSLSSSSSSSAAGYGGHNRELGLKVVGMWQLRLSHELDVVNTAEAQVQAAREEKKRGDSHLARGDLDAALVSYCRARDGTEFNSDYIQLIDDTEMKKGLQKQAELELMEGNRRMMLRHFRDACYFYTKVIECILIPFIQAFDTNVAILMSPYIGRSLLGSIGSLRWSRFTNIDALAS